MIPAKAMIRRSGDVVYREVHGGGGLLDLQTGAYYRLNHTGALIWELIGAATTFDELVAAIGGAVDVPAAPLQEEVAEFVGTLRERKLIEITGMSD